MKKVLIGLGILIALLLAVFLIWDPTDDRYDLGEVEYANYDANKTYCRYQITNVKCEQATQYVVGDIICITCCKNRKPPWPPAVGTNNNCPKKIQFTQALNSCTIQAKRLGQTCTNCNPAETKAVLECPNP